jgi:tRNA G37 N-methylase TrmD
VLGAYRVAPEAVLTGFYEAVTAGDWEKAGSLCDTLLMREYLNRQVEARGKLMKEDSSAYAIAAGMLLEAEVNIKAVEKIEGGREILYSITAGGHEKERKASVMKKEGKWKVAEITGAI